MPSFFIDRPIFAWVVAIFIMIAGVIAIPLLPIAQYPDVAPPQITVTHQLSRRLARGHLSERHAPHRGGAERGAGPALFRVHLRLVRPHQHDDLLRAGHQYRRGPGRGAEPHPPRRAAPAARRVASRASRSTGRAPASCWSSRCAPPMGRSTRSASATISAATSSARCAASTASAAPRLFATQRSMRIWMDPDKMVGLNLTADDIIAAITAQNAQVAAGRIGALPNPIQPADLRDRAGAGPAHLAGAVRRHRAARQSRRLVGAAGRRRHGRDRRREL